MRKDWKKSLVKIGGRERFPVSDVKRLLGTFFVKVDWGVVAPELRSPYFVWTEKKGIVDISEKDFRAWELGVVADDE